MLSGSSNWYIDENEVRISPGRARESSVPHPSKESNKTQQRLNAGLVNIAYESDDIDNRLVSRPHVDCIFSVQVGFWPNSKSLSPLSCTWGRSNFRCSASHVNLGISSVYIQQYVVPVWWFFRSDFSIQAIDPLYSSAVTKLTFIRLTARGSAWQSMNIEQAKLKSNWTRGRLS